ncbi:MAG: hypothetical protein IPJ41_15390 [Phycisphaerales bacterium]|nr:hypothetical protein [Phycisphaerales bacterium]
MHPALLKLLRMRITAWFRRFVTRGSLVRRILGGVFACYLLVSWVASFVVVAVLNDDKHTDPAIVLSIGPLILALLIATRLATALTSRALEFTAPEMDFLFPAPFSRRQLLVYKLGMGALGGLIFSLFLSGRLMHVGASWLSAFLALFLAFLFTQLTGVLAALARQRLGQGVYGRIALGLVAIILLAAVLAAAPTVRAAGFVDLGAILRSIGARSHDSPIARAALSPFEVFIHILLSPPGILLLAWCAGAIAMLGAILMGIFKLDGLYAEAALAASARSAAKLDRAKRSGSGLVARSAAVRLPSFPHLGGVGPLAWRQLLTAARAWPSVLALFGLIIGMMVLARWLLGDTKGGAGIGGLAFPLYVVFSSLLRFDFRGDLDHFDTLKSLPVRPWAVAMGQLAAPALITAAMIAVVGIALPLFHAGGWWLPTSLLLCALPVGTVVCSIENTVFLLFPTRVTAGSAADTNVMFRHMATAILKVLMLLAAGGVLGGLGALAWFTTKNAAVTIVALTLGACGLAAVGIAMVANSFRRFDPSRDMPA